jgi:hypothetical protein
MKKASLLKWYIVRFPSLGCGNEYRTKKPWDLCIDAILGADNLLLYRRGSPRREDPIKFWNHGKYRFFRSLEPAKRYAERSAKSRRMPE